MTASALKMTGQTKNLISTPAIVVIHFVRFEQTLLLVKVLLWPFSKSK